MHQEYADQTGPSPDQRPHSGQDLSQGTLNTGADLSRPCLETARIAAREFVTEVKRHEAAMEMQGFDGIQYILGVNEEELDALESEPDFDPERFFMERLLAPAKRYDSQLERFEALLLEDPEPAELSDIDSATMNSIIEIRRNLDSYMNAYRTFIGYALVACDPLQLISINRSAFADSVNEAQQNYLRYGQEANRLSMHFLNQTRSVNTEPPG